MSCFRSIPTGIDREDLTLRLQEEALAQYDQREQELGEELMRALERFLLLQIIDQRWREHLHDMDYLQQGIHLRGLAQLDPLVAYKNEAFTLFGDLMNVVWLDFARMIFHVQVTVQEDPGAASGAAPAADAAAQPEPGARALDRSRRGVSYSGGAAASGAQAFAAAAAGRGDRSRGASGDASEAAPVVAAASHRRERAGRNDPCWCGSGKKYKKCHGA